MTLDLKELKRLADAATDGPWAMFYNELGNGVIGKDADIAHCDGFYEGKRTEQEEISNAQFIAASRTAIPALIAEVERLRAEQDELKSDIKKYVSINAETVTENERLREALAFYAKDENWFTDKFGNHSESVPFTVDIATIDGGNRARQALENKND